MKKYPHGEYSVNQRTTTVHHMLLMHRCTHSLNACWSYEFKHSLLNGKPIFGVFDSNWLWKVIGGFTCTGVVSDIYYAWVDQVLFGYSWLTDGREHVCLTRVSQRFSKTSGHLLSGIATITSFSSSFSCRKLQASFPPSRMDILVRRLRHVIDEFDGWYVGNFLPCWFRREKTNIQILKENFP